MSENEHPGEGAEVRAFLIADVRGYSTFTRERGDESAARLAMRFAELARDAVDARGGRVIELMGDGALAVFDDAAQAVRAGLEFLESCAEATQEDPELPLPVGIGIDMGEAIPVEGGFRGKALNMAARLCSKAVGGQLLVTRGVAEGARDAEDLTFESREAVELKGFDELVELVEARSGRTPPGIVHQGSASPSPVPSELDAPTTLVQREHELRWLRGTWRQARRAHGRIVFVSGPAGLGKSRLAAELAAHVQLEGATVHFVGSGGSGGAEALRAIEQAASTTTSTLLIVDDLALHPGAVDLLAGSAEAIGMRPVLLVCLLRAADGNLALSRLIEHMDVRGDGHRVLGPLDLGGIYEIAHSYVDDADELPAESILRSSGGVPARIHEIVSAWARDEAQRRLAAAAEWFTEGKKKQSEGLEFASGVIALKLRGIYDPAGADDLRGSCPYKGLAPFEPSDAGSFFGRERLVGELAARTVGTGLLAIVGASGSGKSSLIMAGLLPSLSVGLLPGSDRWNQVTMRPGTHPTKELETALATSERNSRTVVVVDQFEEVFTMVVDEAERAVFIDRLVTVALDPNSAIVVIAIRADYAGHCAAYPELADLLAANLVLVGPMTPDELRRAIQLPARRAGVRIESELVDVLVHEVADEPGGLPLLSTALVELWQARDGGWIRLDAHERTGGVRGAVSRLAEDSYGQLSEAERNTARTVLLRLVGEAEGDAAVRRRVPASEFDLERDPATAAVLDRLTSDRLLTTNDGMVEIAHEALIREWPRLQAWLEEDATGRRLRGHLTQAAKLWAERDRDGGDLYRGARLSAALDWEQSHYQELNALEREFLTQGRQASEREGDRQRRANRRLRGLLIGTAIFLVVALVAGSLALVQRGRARSAQSAAEAEALTADAQRIGALALAEPSLDRSFLLAVAAVQLQADPETLGDLLSVLQRNPAAFRTIHPSRTEVSSLAVSPDGRLLATGDSAGVVHFVDLQTWMDAGGAVRLDSPVSTGAMSFSPDGRSLAVATATDRRSALQLIDVASRNTRRIRSWPSVPSPVGPVRYTKVAFSPDGTEIVASVGTSPHGVPFPEGERLFLLDASSGRTRWQRQYPLRPGQQEVEVAFASNDVLVTSAAQGETLLWDRAKGRVVRRFDPGGPFSLAPGGHVLAIAQNSADPADPRASMALLDVRTGRLRSLEALPVHAWIVGVSFTPDGMSILGRSFDGGLRVWDADTGSISETFTGQATGLNVAVDPSGRTALSGAQDGSVVAWDLSGSQQLGAAFRWNTPESSCSFTPCIAVNTQSTLMATDQADGTVALVDLRTHELVRTLPARNGPFANALAFLPDGRTLVTGGSNGRITFWDTSTGIVDQTWSIDHPVWWVAASPDGTMLAVQKEAAHDSTRSIVEMRNIATGDIAYSHEIGNPSRGLAFSPDGRFLAAVGCCQRGSEVVVWDVPGGDELFSPSVEGHATSIAFSPDSSFLGVGTESGQVAFWDSNTGAPLGAPFQVATGAIDPLSFSPDGRLMSVGSGDQSTTVWDISSRKRVGNSFPIQQGVVTVPLFEPSGELLIAYLSNAAEWPMDVATWQRFACQVAGRDITEAEWSALLPDRPFHSVCPGSPS